MTNAEKYKEVFGFEPDIKSCPTDNCNVCPLANQKYCTENKSDWWNSEYKENNNGNSEE